MEPTNNQETTAPENAPNLSVNDLQQLAVIVDVAFRKGVFNATEAGPVSALYTKLVNFLGQFDKSRAQTPEEQPKE